MKIYCCNCRKEVEAILIKGDKIYPHRPDLSQLNFYQCPNCKNYVGCHKGTKRALGCIPTPELRLARNKLHAKMDPLWKDKLISRVELYARLSKALGYTYHNGDTKSVQECLHVWDLIDEIEKELRGK